MNLLFQKIKSIFNDKKKIIYFSLFVFGLVFNGCYVYCKYNYKKELINSIEIVVNDATDLENTIIYIKDSGDSRFNYSNIYRCDRKNDTTIVFEMSNQIQMRNVKIYFQDTIQSITIKNIFLLSNNYKYNVKYKNLYFSNGINIINYDKSIDISVVKENSFLEIKETFLYQSETSIIIIAFILSLIVLIVFILMLNRSNLFDKIIFSSIANASVGLFLISIFLPKPISNYAFIFSVLMVLKYFNFKTFLNQKINVLFTIYFLLLLFSDLVISPSGYHNLKATETFLPFLILPIYVSCVKTSKFLVFLPLGATIIGIGFFITSIINAVIFMNPAYFSFNEFTKYAHPVYYSYLVSFSIFYLSLYVEIKNSNKNILLILLFFFLILSGSKLMITTTFAIYILFLLKNKKALIVIPLGALFLFLFPPIQNRFKEVLNFKDISVINEKIIEKHDNEKINGLTLRLLIWQESIEAVVLSSKYLFGLGVDYNANQILKASLIKRGLGDFQKYSTHNQFIETFMKVGILGISVLLLMILYVYYQAIKYKNSMLLILIVLLTFAMLTESVFQRVLGINFFVTVILFLMKPNFLNENSNNWNKRNS